MKLKATGNAKHSPKHSSGAGCYKGRLPAWVLVKIKRAIRNAHEVGKGAAWSCLFVLMLLAMPQVQAQVVGGVACANAQGFIFAEVRVSLLVEPLSEKQYRTVKAEQLVAPGLVVEFAKAPSAYTATGIRIRCSYVSAGDQDVDAYEHSVAMHWRTNRPQIPAGAQAKLGLNVKLVAPGRLLLWIGKPPPQDTNTVSG